MGFFDSVKTFASDFAGGFNNTFPVTGGGAAPTGGNLFMSQVAAGLGAVSAATAQRALNVTATTNDNPLRTETAPTTNAQLTNTPAPLPAPAGTFAATYGVDSKTILLVGAGLLLVLIVLRK